MTTSNGVEIDITMLPDGNYKINKDITYFSKRYRKSKTARVGMISDGASGPAEDILSLSWIIHDAFWIDDAWDDGSKCNVWKSSMVLRDILLEEGRYIRANRWFIATLIAGLLRESRYIPPNPPSKIRISLV